jgi:hypothetical protein
VIGLDTAGARLYTASPTVTSYTIGGLPPSATLHLSVWNATGDGRAGPAQNVTTDASGVVAISVPQQAVFSLAS